MDFRNAYERKEHVGIKFTEPTMAQQHFKDDVDVNKIIDRYTKSGVVPAELVKQSEGVYGDFADYGDFMTMQNKIARSKEAFEALPSDIRERFNNDPANLIAFVNDQNNYDEALKLGLVNKRPSAPVEKPTDAGAE